MCTKIWTLLKKKFSQARFYPSAKIIALRHHSPRFIVVITAGTSDIPVAEEAAATTEILGNKVERIYDIGVAGIHRLFSYKEKILNASVAIVCAGMEGALPSIVGGLVSYPLIGVPTSVGYGGNFPRFDCLIYDA